MTAVKPTAEDTSKCSRCSQVKPRSAFPKNPARKKGIHPWCSECNKVRWAAYRRKPETKERDALRYRRRYAAGDVHRSQTPRPKHAREPHKAAAEKIFRRAVARGDLVRPEKCGDCGNDHQRIHGHHEDYSKPLDVLWLCPACHMKRHRKYPDEAPAPTPNC